MAIFDRLKASYTRLRLRGVADPGKILDDARVINASKGDLNAIAQEAAASCNELCRSAIKANMAAAGINSTNLVAAVGRGYTIFWDKRGLIRFRMPAGEKNWEHKVGNKTYIDTREDGPYIVQASLDAGWVVGLGTGKARAKRSIKAGVAGNKTTRAVSQKHFKGEWTTYTRKEINLGAVTVHRGRFFWQFNASQEAAIVAQFRKKFFELARERGYTEKK